MSEPLEAKKYPKIPEGLVYPEEVEKKVCFQHVLDKQNRCKSCGKQLYEVV